MTASFAFDEPSELAPFAELALPVLVVAPDVSAQELLARLGATEGFVVLRASNAHAPMFVPIAVGVADVASARLEAENLVALRTGLPPSRTASFFEGCANLAAVESTLRARLATWNPSEPGPARLEQALGWMREKSSGPLLAQTTGFGARWGRWISREARTGRASSRVEWGRGPGAWYDGALLGSEPTSSGPASLDAIEPVLRSLEIARMSAFRLGLVAEGDVVRVATIAPIRRSGAIATALAIEAVDHGRIDRSSALAMLDPLDLGASWPEVLEAREGDVLAVGIAAGTGVAEGFASLSPEGARRLGSLGLPVVLFVHDLDPEDVDALRASSGVVCVRGGITGEAAVMARALGKPCIASGASVRFGERQVVFDERAPLREGERVTVDAARGRLVRGSATTRIEPVNEAASTLLGWLDEAQPELLAGVTTEAHVRTAALHRCRGVVLAAPNELLFEAMQAGGDLDDALTQALVPLFRAETGGAFVLRVDPTLFERLDSDKDGLGCAAALARAGVRAAEATGAPLELVTAPSSWVALREALGGANVRWSLELLAHEEPPKEGQFSRIFTPFDAPLRSDAQVPVVRVARRDALRLALARAAREAEPPIRPLGEHELLACPTSELLVARWWIATSRRSPS
jgi:phosphohistidine swiveling domain-containing protein